jgi:hypothetical protein
MAFIYALSELWFRESNLVQILRDVWHDHRACLCCVWFSQSPRVSFLWAVRRGLA